MPDDNSGLYLEIEVMLYKDKIPWIKQFIRGKKVLDLGCVRHNLEETEKEEWLHGVIKNEAESVLGVDYLEKEVEELKRRGFNVVCANVETMELGDKYDLIVAGDLIEHLNNFGLFLDRVRNHLKSDGIFILTTPNPVNPMRFFSVLLRGEAGANSEHTCWFTEQVLRQLIERYGMRIDKIDYVDDTYQYYKKNNFKWWPFLSFNYLAVRMRHQFAETICVSIKLK